MLTARLTGIARGHARWGNLTEDQAAAAVAELREVADGRADLLAEVAGIALGSAAAEAPSARCRRRPSRSCAALRAPTRA